MSTKQPDALEQAEYLEKGWFDEECNRITAAAELRRLHAANVELVEDLKRIVSTVPAIADGGGFVVDHHSPDGEYMGTENIDPAWVIQEMASVAVNAIAKHGGQS